jgi:hypothetical protein
MKSGRNLTMCKSGASVRSSTASCLNSDHCLGQKILLSATSRMANVWTLEGENVPAKIPSRLPVSSTSFSPELGTPRLHTSSFCATSRPVYRRSVFTHGDLHQGNIIVDRGEDDLWQIAGIVDWENSGFYPAYWEAVKMTNCLAPIDAGDWYLYPPDSIAPQRYAVEWLADRVLDWHLKNS